MQGTVVDEKSVVTGLLTTSQPFAAFYNSQRAKMPTKITWVVGGAFESGMQAYTYLQTNTVHLRQLPPFPNDAFIIAHELSGFLLQAQGFPILVPKPGSPNPRDAALISGALNTMLWTPLRDALLSDYGFNLGQQYSLYVKPFFDPTDRPQPTDEADKFEKLYFYVQMVIYWEDVLGNEAPSEFQRVFDQAYPSLADQGHYTIAKIRTYAYDSPQKMKAFYSDILVASNLDSIIELR